MKFTPCQDLCSKDSAICSGCGRTQAEIAATKQIVKTTVDFIQQQGYDNPEDFVAAISKSILKKVHLS